MFQIRSAVLFAVAAIWSIFLPIMGLAGDATNEISNLRMEQAKVSRELEAVRDMRAMKQSYLEEGRHYIVPILVGSIPYAYVTTLEDALKSWTLEYFRALGSDPFVVSDFEAWIKKRRDDSLRIQVALEDSIDQLASEEADLVAKWRMIENQIAGLMQKDSAKPTTGKTQAIQPDEITCAELVRTEVADTPLGARASTNGWMQNVTDQGYKGSTLLNLELAWTTPPLKLCEGDQFQLQVIAANATPADSNLGLNFVAEVSVSGLGDAIETVSCSNAPTSWIDRPKEAATLAPKNSEYVNGCTFRVVKLPTTADPKALLRADFGTALNGTGSVNYFYVAK